MPATTGVTVIGLRELTTAFATIGGQVNTEFRAAERQIAEPVRRDAEALTGSQIRNMHRSPRWMKMRTGITRTLVYVAPRQRGVKGRGRNPRSRPNLADLMMKRAMEPALKRHTAEIERELEQVLDRVARDFNH